MDNKVSNPLVIRCGNCGGEVSFDVIKQHYVCAHCGTVTEASKQSSEFRNWRQLQQQKQREELSEAKMFCCPSCGAQTMAAGDDVSAQCPFCQSTMVDAQFADSTIPEIIIPFKLTQEEALKRLRDWVDAHRRNPAAAAIGGHLQSLTGCYLPYHIVRGAFNADMEILNQAGEMQKYPFKAYLSHTAVNASKDWNNLFLDGIEPFDFSEARDFDFRFLVHQKAKIQNVWVGELANRIKGETVNELHGTLAEMLHTKEFQVSLYDQDNETIPAALPVYLVQCGNGVAAAVNGQTGKVSVATGRTLNLTRFWWIWPIAFALLVGTVVGVFGDRAVGIGLGIVFGLILLVVAHQRHVEKIVDEILTNPKSKKSHNDTQAVFMTDFGKGLVPSRIKFFTPLRIAKIVLGFLVVTFFPAIIAILIQLARGRSILDINYLYGGAWYIIPVFFAIAAIGGLAKAMMYNSPMYYEILPNGRTRRRKMKGSQSYLKGRLGLVFASKKTGCLVIAFILFLLIGSVAAML